MKLKGITITKGMTVNLGNFNSTRVEVGLTGEFDIGDDYAIEMENLSTLVTAKLRDEVHQISKTTKKSKKQTLMEGEA